MGTDMTEIDSSKPAVASRFLALPGELRNRIYEAINEDEGPKEICLRWFDSEDLKTIDFDGLFLMDRNPGRQYIGLAQTNRMFRSEFMPLYMTVPRLLVNIEDVSYYLEVFPLPDPVLTASIITSLGDFLSVIYVHTPTAKIDLLPLLRTDLSMFPFSIFTHSAPPGQRKWGRELSLLLLENSYHDLALYGGSWEETITTMYYIREFRIELFCSYSTHYNDWIELQLCAKVDVEASDFEKLRIFHNFVNRTQAIGYWRVEIRCISGRLSMSCVNRKAITAKNLGPVKKACRVWSAKSRRYILAAKKETNKAARNASV
ncbi:unnamed protein product [Alternaria burnsii]|nr:unnamed protein product [Alternaria burnsii]